MVDVKISDSSVTRITTPLFGRAIRIPVYDPSAPTSLLYAEPSDVAAALSPVVVTLSSLGITSDATNGLAYGVSAPAGSTGQEAAINAALAAAWTAAGGQGLQIIWDVAVALGGPVYIPGSYTEIIAPTKACGAILRAGANCPILRSPGLNSNMTIAQNTQNTFGKFDPSAPGGSHNYRVFDPAYVWAQRIVIRGGTWNANYPQQSAAPSNATYGFISTFQLSGIDGLKLFDLDMLLANCFNLYMCNVRNIEYGGILVDCIASVITTDGVHFNGPATGIRGGHVRYHGGDDNLAFNADDDTFSAYTGITVGVNAACGGDITNIIAEGPDIWEGTENAVSRSSIRFNSTYHRIDNAIIRGSAGQATQWNLWIVPWPTPLCPGNGNFGHIRIEDDTHDMTQTGGSIEPGVIAIGGNCDVIEIIGRYRYNAQATPDIYVQAATSYNGGTSAAANISKLIVEWNGWQASGAANNTQPAVLVAGNVYELKMTGSKGGNSANGVVSSPFLRVTTGGHVVRAVLNITGDYITSLVDYAAGQLDTLIFSGGAHTNAGGGSPLAIASGLTLANYLYGNLVFKTGTAPFSGSGTVTVSSATNSAYSGP